MPKRIDPAVKERTVQCVCEHRAKCSSLAAACAVIAKQERLGKETVRRWAVQAEVDRGERPGVTSEENAQIRDLKAKVKRLEEGNEILRRASILFAGGSPPETADCRLRRDDGR